MLRRLIAAVLLAAIALPMPALAAKRCSMSEPWISSEVCDCCKGPAATSTGGDHCRPAAATLDSGCTCTLRSDAGSQPASPATVTTEAPAPTIHVALLPAALSTPWRTIRAVDPAASPPGAGSTTSRPILCSWIL